MKEQKKSNKKFDPSGSYTGKYYRADEDEIVDTQPEQDVDDL